MRRGREKSFESTKIFEFTNLRLFFQLILLQKVCLR